MEEKLSAMLDGDVDDAVALALFKRLKNDKTLRDDWDAYCLLGDAIRGDVSLDGGHPDDGFVARVMSRLDDEPTILAPQRREHGVPHGSSSLWHRLLPVAASVMGVLAVGGVVATLSSGGGGEPPLEVAQVMEIPSVAAPDVAPVVARTAELTRRDYMVAHQAVAGGPMPAAVHYVRTVSGSAEE
jgi:sigma-E factor negative regulatory protein RseA